MTFGFVKQIWANQDTSNTNMSDVTSKKQAILDSLYHHCQTRTYTSNDVLAKLMVDLKIFVVPDKQPLLDVIREYKNTGKNLEATVDTLYDVLYTSSSSDNDAPAKDEDWNMP